MAEEPTQVGDLYVIRAPTNAPEFAGRALEVWRREMGPSKRLIVLSADADLEVIRPPSQLAAWAYQYVGALSARYCDAIRVGDLTPLLDVLSALANGADADVSWPAELPAKSHGRDRATRRCSPTR
jgi:hypothetical protein